VTKGDTPRRRSGSPGPRRSLARRPAAEQGQALVLSAILLPLVLLIGVIAVDVGNWWVHSKRLQTLVDAGAFAGAAKFVGCSFQFGDPPAANLAIKAAALEYAGDTTRFPGTRNVQEQTPDDVHVVLNSARYWQPGDPTDGAPGMLDDTLDPDGDPLTAGDPCTTRTLSVKGTDEDAPLLFGFVPFTAHPKKHARVEIRQIQEQSGMLPFAVPETDPAAVAAIFVDESTGEVLAHPQLLMKQDDPDLPFSEWTTSPLSDLGDLPSENTGIVILTSKIDDTPMLTSGPPGTLDAICGQAPKLVKCYAGSGNTSGLSFIHGWSDAPASPSAAQVRDVYLSNVDCPSYEYSAPYFLTKGECRVSVTAVVDFGVTGDPRDAPDNADVERNGDDMTWVGTLGTESTWVSDGINLNEASGRGSFSITWSTNPPGPGSHSGSFPGVAHPYVANAESGPVEYLDVTTGDAPVVDANSRNQGDDRSVRVTVGLRRPFQLEDPLAPPVLLRVASPSGSQNQAFDCDANIGLREEIKDGCKTTYGLNYDDFDHDGDKEWADILCDDYPNGAGLPPDQFFNQPAPDCVRVEPGDKTGPFRQGLADRFETPTCVPNNWPEDEPPAGRGPEDDDAISAFFQTYDFANDPRYVTLVVTDSTAFSGTGSSEAFPVKYFAGFYATGWDVGGATSGCADNDPHPRYGTGYSPSRDNGDVWGHFVNIVVFSASGLASDELCNFDGLGNCIAVLVE
jgi:Putative Flp pilus-assembly TadE/G-like